MAFKLGNRFINIDRPFVTAEGVKYPHLRSAELREKLGVVEVADEPWYDQRFYWGVDNPKLLNDRPEVKEDGTPLYVQIYNAETEQMEDTDVQVVTKGLKSQWIAQVKATAGSLLAQTDWMIIRKAERDVAIPEAIQTYRAAVIAEADRLEAAINNAPDIGSFITIVGNQDWPKAE